MPDETSGSKEKPSSIKEAVRHSPLSLKIKKKKKPMHTSIPTLKTLSVREEIVA